MYIQLSFSEKTYPSTNETFGIPSKSIKLLERPIIVDELPDGVTVNSRSIVTDGESSIFNYYIDCEAADREAIERAITMFTSEYKAADDKRFVENTNPEVIPAVILMKNALQRCFTIDNSNNGTVVSDKPSKGVAVDLPENQPSKYNLAQYAKYATSRNLLFATAAAGAAIVTAATIGYFVRSRE